MENVNANPGQKIFEIQSYEINDAGDDFVETQTVQGYLAVTPDFIAVTDEESRVTFYMPSHRVKKAVATGDVPATPTAPIDLSNVVAIGSAN